MPAERAHGLDHSREVAATRQKRLQHLLEALGQGGVYMEMTWRASGRD